MKILISGLNFAPEVTGTGRYTGEMAAWLAGRGHEVHAIVGVPHYPEWKVPQRYRGLFFRTEEWEGVKVHRTPAYVPGPDRVTSKGRLALEATFGLASLRHWIPTLARGPRFDVTIAVCPPMQTAFLPLVYRALFGVPMVFHVQDDRRRRDRSTWGRGWTWRSGSWRR